MEHLKNALYIISYVMMVAVVLLVTVFYRQPLASVLLVFLIILPFISLASGAYGYKHISVTATAPVEHINAGDEFRIRFHIRNTSPVPLLRCTLLYSYCNLYRKDDEKFSMTLAGESFASEKITLSFKTSMPGMFVFDADKILISDPLHFHTFTGKANIHITIPVMPKAVPLPDKDLPKFEGEPFDDLPSENGELTRDIRQLREYRAGDRLRDIHWKASASAGELMVKEYERSIDLMYLVIPEILKGKEEGALVYYYSLGKKMISGGMGFRTAIYDPDTKVFSYMNVSDEKTLDESVYEIMRKKASEEEVYSVYIAQNPAGYGAIRICHDKIVLN